MRGLGATALIGVLYQSFSINSFVAAAFAGIDNKTVQFTWRDLTADATTPIIYQLNANATNVGVLTYQLTVHFAQRTWSYEFANLITQSASSSVIESLIGVVVLLVCAIAVLLFTVIFVRNR
jgi:CHASE1-domain containing sensor protein